MKQTTEYTLDKIEDVWSWWKCNTGNVIRSQTAMQRINELLYDANKEILEDQGCEPVDINKLFDLETEAEASKESSTARAMNIVRDIEQRNYGMAEMKARVLVHQLRHDAAERRRAKARQAETKPDIFLKEMNYRIKNLEKTGPHSEHGQGMRAGFMYARAIYEGTRK